MRPALYLPRIYLGASMLITAAAACSPAGDVLRPVEAPNDAEPDRMIVRIASERPDGFFELDTISIVATVFRRDGGEVDVGSVLWVRNSELGIQARGPRSAQIRLLPGTNSITASYVKADGSILSASLSIPARPTTSVIVLWESDGTITTILPPSDVDLIRPTAINDRGEVVGTADVVGFRKRAWIWSKTAGFRFIGTGNEDYTEARDINDDGTVVGFRRIGSEHSGFLWTATNGLVLLPGTNPAIAIGITNSGAALGIINFRAVRWRPTGGFDELALTPGSKCSGASAIGSTGYAVGWVGASFEDGWCLHASPVMWSPDGSVEVIRDCSKELDCGYNLHDVNAEGEAIGGTAGGRPFRWTRNDGLRELLGDATGIALGLNDRGEIAGAVNYPYAVPTVWSREGSSRALALPPGRAVGTAHAINNKGDVVGVVK